MNIYVKESDMLKNAANCYTGDPRMPFSITGGKIAGTLSEDGKVAIYKGIPFAAVPVGKLRWKEPQPVEKWEDVLCCETFGNNSWQPVVPKEFATGHQMFTAEFNADTLKYGSCEDCLYLNVWTKAGDSSQNKPVIVYIHGGGFSSGSGSVSVYDGEAFAKQGIVYVTINYRLNMFGFFTSPELDVESEQGVSGNYGILDQIAALKWVKENIAKFGGNPENVTIAGQSAGASSVMSMIDSPLAAGLFKNAVPMSGVFGFTRVTKKDVQKICAIAQGDYNLDQLRNMSIEELMPVSLKTLGIMTGCCTDGYVFKKHPVYTLRAKEQNTCNIMTGWVEGDILGFIFGQGIPACDIHLTMDDYAVMVEKIAGHYADKILKLYPAANDTEATEQFIQLSIDNKMVLSFIYCQMNREKLGKTGYLYYFDHDLPGGDKNYGPFHTADMGYWMNYFTDIRKNSWTKDDFEMGSIMNQYLANFAIKDDPNGENLPVWDNCDQECQYMHIGDNTYEMIVMDKNIVDFWVEFHKEMTIDTVFAPGAMLASEE